MQLAGVAGLALAAPVFVPENALAATLKKVKDDDWYTLPDARLYIDFRAGQQVKYTINDSNFKTWKGTWVQWGTTDPDNDGTLQMVYLDKTVAVGDKYTSRNAFNVLLPDAVLDTQTNERYDLSVDISGVWENTGWGASEPESQYVCVFRENQHVLTLYAWTPHALDTNMTLACKVLDSGGKVVNQKVGFIIQDLDIGYSDIQEGINLVSGFSNAFVDEDSWLTISNSNSSFHATGNWWDGTNPTGKTADYDTDENKETRLGLITSGGEFTFSWDGYACGTSIFGMNYSYPGSTNPSKKAVTPKVW